MFALTRKIGLAVAAAALVGAMPTPARAGVGDLLVAPTRIVLDGGKGTEIVLNNIGDTPATYRISVEFRRMTADGNLEDVAEPTAQEKEAEDMIVYAPRRVTLAPHEPQSIRITARPPQGLPDGEYRVHLLFRAIPDFYSGHTEGGRNRQGPPSAADPSLWRDDSRDRASRQSPGRSGHLERCAREEGRKNRSSRSISAARAHARRSARWM